MIDTRIEQVAPGAFTVVAFSVQTIQHDPFGFTSQSAASDDERLDQVIGNPDYLVEAPRPEDDAAEA